MKDTERIAAQVTLDWRSRSPDNQTNELLTRMIKCAIEKMLAPVEHALLETQVKAAALQRQLDEFQAKLDFEAAQRKSLEQFMARLRENQAFDRAAREVWKKQLEIATEVFKSAKNEDNR
jgi:uncharacterized membrane-anchored protein YjiN (DUF445 family)